MTAVAPSGRIYIRRMLKGLRVVAGWKVGASRGSCGILATTEVSHLFHSPAEAMHLLAPRWVTAG